MKDLLSIEQDKADKSKFTVHYTEKEVKKRISYEVENEELVEEIVSTISYFMVRILLRS
jgi:hypothetical protein